MKIITIYLPESYLMMMEKFIGENATYPSRCELIRVAVREYLIRELKTLANLQKAKFLPNTPDDIFEAPLYESTQFQTFQVKKSEDI